jgi:beta-galactosidase
MIKYFNLALLLVTISTASAQPRIDKIIDADWKFTRENGTSAEAVKYSDAHWQNISLPHTWNARDGQDGGNDYYRGVGWYRKYLKIDSKLNEKNIYLKFDGVGTTAYVYVNGKLAGSHKGNFGAFCFDVTNLVNFGKTNLIAVKVSNAKDTTVTPLRGDFTIFGGIYRSVHFIALDKLCISPLDHASSGVYVKQSNVSIESAKLGVTTVVRNASGIEKNAVVRCTVSDSKGNAVERAESKIIISPTSQQNSSQYISINSPRLWNGMLDPYMYKVTVEVFENGAVTDKVEELIGLRYYSVDPDKGFFLNGKPYRLYGVNRHQDREDKGWAIEIKEHIEDFQLIKEMGCTAVRLAHYQQAKEFYELFDRSGIIVIAELSLVDEIHPNPAFAENCKEQLTELIKQNFNNPSIIFWSIFNELMPDANRELYGRVVDDLNALAKQLDPTRFTTMASRARYDGSEYMNTVTDLFGYNVYRGWYEGQPEDFGGYADSLRDRFPEQRIAIHEYGAGASIYQHEYPTKKHPTRGPWHPEEWQNKFHEVHWTLMAARPYLWGTFVWNMFDFASDGRSEGDRNGINDKGLVTYNRKIKKDAFYWYKANWNPEAMVHITSKRYSPRPLEANEVKVYSNCDSVALFVNGKQIGTKTSDDKMFIWSEVEFAKGSNNIEAVGFIKGKSIKDTCKWDIPKECPNIGIKN